MATTEVGNGELPLTCDSALKEWAVAIEALGQGRLALIIRKGGIREERNRFEVRFPEFLFFPSFEHQQTGLLRPEHAAELADAMAATADNDHLTFTHFAKVHSAFPVTELAELESLAPHHIWTQEYAEKRLRWRPRVALTAMVLRVYKLPEAKQVPMRTEYAGCKSWLQLLDTVTIDALEPAMSDAVFEAEAAAIDEAMASAKALA
jgi:hypothetical protein